MPKVAKIVDPEFKTGVGKKGKWTLVKVQVDDKIATGFLPIEVGDEVSLEYNDEYKNWNFKKIGPQEIPSVDINDDLKLQQLTYENTVKILELLDMSGYEKFKAAGNKLKLDEDEEDEDDDLGL